jgi:hypothetical protein
MDDKHRAMQLFFQKILTKHSRIVMFSLKLVVSPIY